MDVILCFLPELCFIAGLYRDMLKIPVIGSEWGNLFMHGKKFLRSSEGVPNALMEANIHRDTCGSLWIAFRETQDN